MNERQDVMQRKAKYEAFSKQAIRSEFFRGLVKSHRSYRHVLRLMLNIGMFFTILGAEYLLWQESKVLGALFYPVYLFFQALIVSGFIIHCHEFTHRRMKLEWLNDMMGVVTGFFGFVNFYSFKVAHHLHHANIGNLDAPEAGAPVSAKGQKKIRHADRCRKLGVTLSTKSPFLWLFLAWPVFIWFGDYHSWMLPFARRGKVDRKSLGTFVIFALVNVLLLANLPLVYLALYLPAMALGGNRFLSVTYLHHADESLVFFSEEHHKFHNVIMASTDRNFGPLVNFFMMDIGYHIPHHMNPQIAYYDLKKASEYLRSNLPADLSYAYFDDSHLYRDLAKSLYEQRIDADHEFFQIAFKKSITR